MIKLFKTFENDGRAKYNLELVDILEQVSTNSGIFISYKVKLESSDVIFIAHEGELYDVGIEE